jgi:hypothetical protein
VLDVRVHAGEGELDRQQAGARTALEERLPSTRDVARRRVVRRQPEHREADVELGHERVVVERAARQSSLHHLRDAQVDVVEHGHPVACVQRIVDRLHPGDDALHPLQIVHGPITPEAAHERPPGERRLGGMQSSDLLLAAS